MSDTGYTSMGGADLRYTDDLGQMAVQYADSKAFGAGGALTLAIVTMRQGLVFYGENKTAPGTFGWKGIDKTLKLASMKGVSNPDLSKATKVVNEFLPETLLCDADEIVSHVLLFVAEHGSLSSAYDAWNRRDKGRNPQTPGVWSLHDALETVLRKAVKEGFILEDVSDAWVAALANHYATPEPEPEA